MRFEYKKLTPFKRCILENFPFIEADFDAIEEYELLCKVVDYLNKVINNNNEMMENIEELNNWFDNLDVQDEINNKLNTMAEDGTLENIINQDIFDTLNQRITTIENDLTNNTTIMIGDSYGVGTTSGGSTTGWCDRLKDLLELPSSQYYKFVEGSSGFCRTGLSGHTFQTLLELNISQITNKNLVKNIIVCGGYNDNSYDSPTINTSINNFVQYCKTNFPNAKVYLGMVGNNSSFTEAGANLRYNLRNNVLRSYQNVKRYGGLYLNGIENVLHDYGDFMSADFIHPNDTGYRYLAQEIYNCFITGNCDFVSISQASSFTPNNSTTNVTINTKLNNNITQIDCAGFTMALTSPVSIKNDVKLGTIEPFYLRPAKHPHQIPVSYYLKTPNNLFYGGTGYIDITNTGDVMLRVKFLKNDGTSYYQFDNIDTIHIDKFNYVMSTDDC